ncbi:hypothetical protein LPJ61_005874 [Coemansia biformis]|uniref:Nudix hydrolase domain-containing protein n=1 Tax=Coemansia biformis TaxID=1286918 RepID=A0A9W7Y2T6_9FUNG|nr:hypothetical protein LPJ61_005874 [Coemansia biformis]
MSQVLVGVACFVVRRVGGEPQFLVGHRQGSSLAPDTWGLPGGHLEVGEEWETCIQRELLEECGIHVPRPRHVATTNDILGDVGKHYVTVFMAAELDSYPLDDAGEPLNVRLMEPEYCKRWAWVTWDELRRRQAPLRDACAAAGQGTSSRQCGCTETIQLDKLFFSLEHLEELHGDKPLPWLAPPRTLTTVP